MSKSAFGSTKDGTAVEMYTIRNARNMEADIVTIGAALRALRVPDRDGNIRDVLLGYDTAEDYQNVRGYLGAVIGRNGNRIAGAKFVIDGVEYRLEENENGNNLHSGSRGFHSAVWNVAEADEAHVKLTLRDPDGNQGFPGNMDASITYTLTDEGELVLEYGAVADKKTVANFTNHAYFNLDGHDSGSIEGQELQIMASRYTPVADSESIPTGELADVGGTPMDFREMTAIGARIGADFDQLAYGGGYDSNYAIDGADGSLRLAARAFSARSGIQMEVYTDCVGIQFYSGNFVGGQSGKGGAAYAKRQGFCLETQYFPNSANERNFKQPFLSPGEAYASTTKYRFSVK